MRAFLNILLIVLCASSSAQTSNLSVLWKSDLDLAHEHYQKRLYADAVSYYRKALNHVRFGDLEYRRLADSYRILKQPKAANTFYSLYINDMKENQPDDLFHYGESLLSAGDVEGAKKIFEEYYYLNANDERVKNRISSLFQMEKLYRDSLAYRILLTEVNSNKSEMSSQVYNDGLVFSSVAGTSLVVHDTHQSDELPLYQLYYSNFDSLYIKHAISAKGGVINVSGPAIAEDGKMIVAGNNWRGFSVKKDTANNLQLFEADLKDSLRWASFKPIAFCDEEYSYMSPWVSADYDTLMFASNMPGGSGGFDLYVSVYDGANWTKPVNLGDEVNSQGDDLYPTFRNGTLYFSSNGHGGLGGLDVVYSTLNDFSFEEPVNMGYPLNSHMDDFAITFTNDSEGFFTSNRTGGAGSDDIYAFSYDPIEFYNITLQIADSITQKGLNNAIVEVADRNSTRHFLLSPDEHGIVTMEVSEFDDYDLSVIDEGYYSKELSITDPREDMHLSALLKFKPIFERIELSNLIYDFDKYHLKDEHVLALDTLVPTLQQYEYLKVDVESHTDARGGEEYNLELSEKRAESIAAYLSDKGVSPERINTIGYGESQLIYDCSEINPCSGEQHEANRRTILVIYTDEK